MERPYEKCLQRGAESLSDAELLAVILRTGTRGENALLLSQKLLYHTGENGILGLHYFTTEQLMKIKGIGKVKAVQIQCIAQLARRLSKACAAPALSFTSAGSIADYYMEDLRHQKQEIMKLVMLNSKGMLIGDSDISKGTVNAALITPREIYIEALQKSAVAVVVLHNHPSGDPAPSEEDFLVTERIDKAGKIIGIELLDHIIIGNNCYVSLCEEGFLRKG